MKKKVRDRQKRHGTDRLDRLRHRNVLRLLTRRSSRPGVHPKHAFRGLQGLQNRVLNDCMETGPLPHRHNMIGETSERRRGLSVVPFNWANKR